LQSYSLSVLLDLSEQGGQPMSNLARIEQVEPEGSAEHLYIELIRRTMKERDLSIRALEALSHIDRSRLSRILHADPAHRRGILLTELLAIFRALDLDLMQAVVNVEVMRTTELENKICLDRLFAMLTVLYRELAPELVGVYSDIANCDGTEVDPIWARALKDEVVKRFTRGVEFVRANKDQALARLLDRVVA
jgi:transcriptional regulator with XRE-family HTH domain